MYLSKTGTTAGVHGRLIAAALALAAMPLLGCGGSSSGPSCGTVGTCGGDIVGKWTIQSSCVDFAGQMSMPSLCNDAITFHASNVQLAGSVTYQADGTYQRAETFSGTVAITFPAACLTMSGITVTCDQLNQVLKQSSAQFGGISCTGAAGGGCVCNAPMTNQTVASSGTYTAQGGVLTEDQDSSAASNYCIQNNQMTVAQTSNLSAADGLQGRMSGTITLTK